MKIFDSPTILFNRKFDDEALTNFVTRFGEIEAEGHEKVTILINSPGGSLDVLKTMLDVIYNTEMAVITAASGLAASCGFALLMAGDHRVAFDGTMLMSHQYSWGSRGKHHELTAARKGQDMTHEFMLGHYKLHTGLSEGRILKELLPAEDTWMSAQEALAFGVIDEIITPQIKPIGRLAKNKIMDKIRKQDIASLKATLATFSDKEIAELIRKAPKVQDAGSVEQEDSVKINRKQKSRIEND